MDLVIRTPYVPKAGETITGSDFAMNPGGKGANQAAACGKLGGEVFMAGCVGEDIFGASMLENLKTYRVNVEGVRKTEGASGIAVITVCDGDNRIILDKGANEKVEEADVDRLLETATAGDIFLVQLENPVDLVGAALKKAKEKGLFTLLNPAPWNDGIVGYLKYVDLLTPNETELALASRMEDIDRGLHKVLSLGVGQVLVTLGGDGYRIYGENEDVKGECMKVAVVDTTAAGDTFTGALAVELARGTSLREAAAFASRCASIACTKYGAMRSIPTREEVSEYGK